MNQNYFRLRHQLPGMLLQLSRVVCCLQPSSHSTLLLFSGPCGCVCNCIFLWCLKGERYCKEQFSSVCGYQQSLLRRYLRGLPSFGGLSFLLLFNNSPVKGSALVRVSLLTMQSFFSCGGLQRKRKWKSLPSCPALELPGVV